MKVLFLANNDAGLYRFRKELIKSLIQDYEVHVACPFGTFVEELRSLGCVLHETQMEVHGMNPIGEYKLYSSYRRLIKSIKPQIVLTYTIKPNVYGGYACQRLHVPYVSNVTGLGTAVKGGGRTAIITQMLYRIGLKKAQKVFFQNSEDRDFMVNKGIVKSNYDLLPGSGVNLDDNVLLPYPQRETIDFIFVSRVMRQKGADQFIDAAKEISTKYPNTRFHICGRCEDEYKDIVEKLGKEGVIQYHGFVKDMKSIQMLSSCTIHPTFYPEGMSNVLLESCACGRPIITTDRSGCREIVEDGVNGFVVKQEDSQDLIEKVEKFLSLSWEKQRAMGLAGRAKVEREFDRNIVVDKYLEEISRAGL